MAVPEWVWREVVWPRPFTPEQALDLLDRLASDRSLGEVVFEARADSGRVRSYVAVHPGHVRDLTVTIGGLVHGARVVVHDEPHPGVELAGHLTASHPSLALSVDRITAVTRAVLASLAGAKQDGERLVLQVILGTRLSPTYVPNRPADPEATWFDLLLGGPQVASPEQRASMKTRRSLHGFRASIRIGSAAETPERRRALIEGVLAGLRVSESAGARFWFHPEHPDKLSGVRRPWRYPLALSSKELSALMGWPLGSDREEPLPGHPSAHPRLVPAPESVKPSKHPFAVTTAPGQEVRFGLSARDSLRHVHLIGPIGSGKSVATVAMVEEAMHAGRGVLVIDPKDLTDEILARVPEHRRKDVVVIDPTADRVVGINPFRGDGRSAELRADAILAVFQHIFADSWGAYTRDVMTAAVMTLARRSDATLTMLVPLLTDDRFRAKMTRGLDDQLGLDSFWAGYEAMTPAQRSQMIAPVLNKLRAFTLRKGLRNVLGQARPAFDLQDLFTRRRIVIVSLNKGLIGEESAKLLGSLIVGTLWPLILGRAALPPERRHIVNIYIDEVQSYLALPSDLEEAMSQSRSLGVSFTLNHQYLKQLPTSLREGLEAVALNKVVFGLNASDANEFARQTPGLEVQDFMLLPAYNVYTKLHLDGQGAGWFSARTLPPSPRISDPVELRVASADRYGVPVEQVEAELLQSIGQEPKQGKKSKEDPEPDEPIGRRPASPRRPS